MPEPLIFLTIPGLSRRDWAEMPFARSFFQDAPPASIDYTFPSVTWPAQANFLTGGTPRDHGVTANGFYWRDEQRVEMWTAWNKVIERPQIWDNLRESGAGRTSAAWFPMLSKGCQADFVCMPAPIHRPDGSEDLWCYTKPQEWYGELLQQLGHFPLQHFWGPLANIRSSEWIARSAALTAQKFRPDFFYIYLPHLDYAAQKTGPGSPEALHAAAELDRVLEELCGQLTAAYPGRALKWTLYSEYVILPVDHVTYPNRILREAGWLQVREGEGGGEVIDWANSRAWALVDHQFSHVFVQNPDAATLKQIKSTLAAVPGIAQVFAGDERREIHMDHPRSGELVAISQPNSWQAYYWWLDDQRAPSYARTVDIHRKPGYDPVELFFDPATRSIPLEPERIRGSHGVVNSTTREQSVLATRGWRTPVEGGISDRDLAARVMNELK